MSKIIPIGKAGQKGTHTLILCMENVWTVFMNQNSIIVRLVITVSTDVASTLNYQYLFIFFFCFTIQSRGSAACRKTEGGFQ